jgi:hypothetical protein
MVHESFESWFGPDSSNSCLRLQMKDEWRECWEAAVASERARCAAIVRKFQVTPEELEKHGVKMGNFAMLICKLTARTAKDVSEAIEQGM